MPRLPHTLLLRAYRISPLLPLILQGTRTLRSAINELRWIREHVEERTPAGLPESVVRRTLLKCCQRRSRGEPLQYILGTQPFGELDILCRPGVLIPRPTEAYTSYLAKILLEKRKVRMQALRASCSAQVKPYPSLRIVDLCTGTGCILLLLQSLLSSEFEDLHLTGWDVSNGAISLARKNLQRVETNQLIKILSRTTHSRISFRSLDVFANLTSQESEDLRCDVLISNPPYISEDHFNHETARSVRNWEPKLALVPTVSTSGSFAPEDIFYHRLLFLHFNVCASKVLLMEVGDEEQAFRVTRMTLEKIQQLSDRSRTITTEIWRDWPEAEPPENEDHEFYCKGQAIPLKGSGKLRAVFVFENGALL
ncbi:HemK family methyltransferase [Amylocarpus encephaloides]|uniref:HemK family methyltransferase n=1 Tax=Amylocarpus encephaloides TaxID=45428 RepID=A0A9P7YEV2_9HELO|nr:HemK family methyltransferase [Amylocarpus encephaloides]